MLNSSYAQIFQTPQHGEFRLVLDFKSYGRSRRYTLVVRTRTFICVKKTKFLQSHLEQTLYHHIIINTIFTRLQ